MKNLLFLLLFLSTGHISTAQKTKKPKINRSLAKVGYWVYHNKGSAQIDLEAGIRDTIAWFNANYQDEK